MPEEDKVTIPNGRLRTLEIGLEKVTASLDNFILTTDGFVRRQEAFNQSAQDRSEARDVRMSKTDEVLALLEQRLSSGTCLVSPHGCPVVTSMAETATDHETRLRLAEKVTQICVDHEERLRIQEKETAVLGSRVTVGGVIAFACFAGCLGWILNNIHIVSESIKAVAGSVPK